MPTSVYLSARSFLSPTILPFIAPPPTHDIIDVLYHRFPWAFPASLLPGRRHVMKRDLNQATVCRSPPIRLAGREPHRVALLRCPLPPHRLTGPGALPELGRHQGGHSRPSWWCSRHGCPGDPRSPRFTRSPPRTDPFQLQTRELMQGERWAGRRFGSTIRCGWTGGMHRRHGWREGNRLGVAERGLGGQMSGRMSDGPRGPVWHPGPLRGADLALRLVSPQRPRRSRASQGAAPCRRSRFCPYHVPERSGFPPLPCNSLQASALYSGHSRQSLVDGQHRDFKR